MMSFISVIRAFRVFRMLLLLNKLDKLRIIFKIFGITSTSMFDVILFDYLFLNICILHNLICRLACLLLCFYIYMLSLV